MANLSEYIEGVRANTFSGMQRLGEGTLGAANRMQGTENDLAASYSNSRRVEPQQLSVTNQQSFINQTDVKMLSLYNIEVNVFQQQMNNLEKMASKSKLGTWLKNTFDASSIGKMFNNPMLLLEKVLSTGMKNDSNTVSFEVLLHSEQAAKKLMQDLSRIKMDQGALSGAAEGMLRQGVDQKDVTPLLSSMGDISGGDGESLGRLAAAFTQVNNEGKLLDGTLNQLINAGFNPLLQMSASTGKTMDELKAEMDQGLISTDMLKQSFFDATGEGGQFHNMLEKQADTLGGKWEDFMRKVNGGLLQLYGVIGPVVEKLVEFGGAAFDAVANGLGWLMTKLEEGNPIILGLAGIIGALTIALTIMKASMIATAIYQGILTTVTNLSSLAWWQLNAAMLANPLTWIIAAVIALIALIGYLIYKVDGWGAAWQHTTDAIKFLWDGMVNALKLVWLQFSNYFLDKIDKMKLAFWALKALSGDKEAVDEMKVIVNRMKERQNEIQETRIKRDGNYFMAAKSMKDAAGSFRVNDKKPTDIKNDLMSKFGFSNTKENPGIADTKETPGTQQINTSINTSQGTQNNANAASTAVNGGVKQNNITINLNDLIGVVNINKAGFQESVEDMEGEVTDALLRLLGSALNTGN
ncbi:tape measure protein [Myroides odoratus]|uniref:tape measure protein n=1 Tax=Myroides odoratus TaxID=256 RepID=UPI0007660453|nr:tape measure protein [Myroides odoratus]